MNVLYPQFLYGLIAIAIPVFIHLFNLRRHKTVYFSNTAPLRAVQKKTKSTSQLRHLLTLLSRILFIAALTLAFAQPYFTKDETAIKSTGKKISIFTDNSLSMDVSTPEGTPLSRAVQHTFAVLDDLNPRDEVQFLTHDFSGKDELLLNAADVQAQIEKLEVSPSSKTFTEVMNRTQLASVKAKEEEFYRFIISDFQNSFWDVDRVEKQVKGKTIFIPVSSTQSPNLAIDSVWFFSPVRYPDVKDSLHIRLVNTSDADVANTKIELFLNGNLQSVISAQLQPGITDTVLYFNAKNTGEYYGEVRIEDAAASFDNQIYFRFRVPEKYNVIEIAEGKSQSRGKIAKVYEGDEFFNYKNYTPDNFDFTDAEKINLIIINEIESAPSTFWSELASFITDGGNAMFFPNRNNEELNNLFLGRLNAGNFSKTDTISGEVADVEYEHELLQGVFETTPKNTLLPGYSMLFPYNNSGLAYTPVFKNKSGSPVLSEVNPGKGKLYLWSVNISQSEIASNTLWLPILYRSVFLSEPESKLFNVIGKDNEIAVGEYEGAKSGIEIVSNKTGSRFKPEVYSVGNEIKIDVHGQIKSPGIYKVETASGEFLRYAAFNYSSGESRFEFTGEDKLREDLESANFGDFEIWESDFETVQAKMSRLSVESTLWQWFIIAACLFLAIEILFLRFLK